MATTPAVYVMVMINMTVEPLVPTYGGKSYVAITTTTEVRFGFTSPQTQPGSHAFEKLTGTEKVVTLALARPWLWRRAGDPNARVAFKASAAPDAPSLADSMTRPVDDLLSFLKAPLDDLASDGRRFSTDVAWHHALENALRQPGQLGRTLGLAHFVTDDSSGTFDAATFASFVRPPDFDATVHEQAQDFVLSARASPISDLERYFDLAYRNWIQSDDDLKRQKEEKYDYFGYSLGSDRPEVDLSDIVLMARVHRYKPRSASSDKDHPSIDDNFWIQLPDDYDFWSGRDWFSRLPMDVADAADLPKHFATGLMNWAAKKKPPTAPIASGQDLQALDVFFRLVVATYGLGARWTYERPNESGSEAVNAPTESVAHSVLSALGLQQRNFADETSAAMDPVQKVLNGVWKNLADNKAQLDNPKLAAILLAAAALQTAQDQATKDLVVQLSIAAQSDVVSGHVADIGWYSTGAKSILVQNAADYSQRKHIDGALGWPNFGFDWQSFAAFFQTMASEFREPNAAGAFVFNRWLAVAQDDAAVALGARRTNALAALAPIRLPQRLTLDGMQDFWISKPGDESFQPDKNDKTPVSIQLLRNRLAKYVGARLVSATANAHDLLGDPKDPDSLISSVQVEIDYYVGRVGGDPDKTAPGTEDADVRELGPDVGVDVPQPLTFQVGAITGGSDEDRLDLMQRFAGFGVLVRNASEKASNSDWHCLTLGQLVPRSGGPPFGNVADTASPTFQSGAVLGHNPWRVVTQAGLDGWVVPFHGAPLTARPKLLDVFDTTDDSKLTPDDPLNVNPDVRDKPYDVVQITSPLVWIDKDHFGFKALQGVWTRWDKLLALAYGRKYAFAFFAQTHSGALPPGLTDNVSPTEFRLPGAIALLDPPPAGDRRLVGLRYLRRTAIGAPRLLKDPSALRSDPVPAEFPLPSREEPWPVFPLAEDLVGRGVLIDPKDAPDPKHLDEFRNRTRPASDEIGRLAVLAPLSKLAHTDSKGLVWGADPKLWDQSPQVAQTVRFALTPPSVPVNDWVLWRTRDLDEKPQDAEAIRNDIRDILASFHKAELTSGNGTAAAREDGRAPDDPAVERLVIRVTKVFDGNGPGRAQLGMWSIRLKDLPRKSDDPDAKPKPGENADKRDASRMWRWQAKSVQIRITAIDYTNAADVELPRERDDEDRPKRHIDLMANVVDQEPIDKGGVEFLVDKGTVYRFEFFAGVLDSLFAKSATDAGIERARIRTLTPSFALGPDRNDKSLRARAPELYATDDGQFRLLSMTAVTVEVADGDLVEAVGRDKVWEATGQLASSGSQIAIGLRNWGDDGEWRFWQAKRAMLNRQLWGWTGRTYRHPIAEYASGVFAEPNTSADARHKARPVYLVQPSETFGGDAHSPWRTFVEEDGSWFGDRADLDSTVSVGLLTPPPQGDAAAPNSGGLVIPMDSLQSGPVYRISFDHDHRAQYWRFSGRLESRYIGLLAPGARNDRGRVRGGWRRLLVKARPTDKLPKPKLKFILPLTEPFDFEGAPRAVPVSSLLVVFEEQWGETAGFAERLVAQVTMWSDDAGPTDPAEARPEIGIDPIVSALAPPRVDGSVLVSDAWPVGLTYDLEIDRPRPAATAFQVRLDDDWLARWTDLKAPHVTAQDVMAMVQFRRIADSALTTVEAEKDEKEDPQSYVSDWTKPEWVIFNADARYWRIQNAERDYDFIHVQDLRMKPDGSIVQQGPHGEVRPALLWANDLGEASAMMRLLFAVVTEDIVAADGGRSEAFLAVGEIKPGANTPNYAGYTPMPVETAKPVAASGGATAPLPRRGRKLRLLEVEMHRRSADLYQDSDFQRGWDKRKLIDEFYGDRRDNFFGVANSPRFWQDDIPESVRLLLKDASEHWLWRFLFPPPGQNNAVTGDAIARIRRVSPPIEMREQTAAST